jgi:twitching motility two-component system response regulator PilG
MMAQSTDQTSIALLFEDPLHKDVAWKLFVSSDAQRLFYATCVGGVTERLKALLAFHQIPVTEWPLDLTGKDYAFIYQLMFSGPSLGLNAVRELLLKLTQEAFTQCLVLRYLQVKPLRLDAEPPLSPILLDIPINQMTAAVKASVKPWISLRPDIPTPFSRFQIDASRISDLVDFWNTPDPSILLRCLKLTQITQWGRLMQEGASLYTLALDAGLSPTMTAQCLLPVLQRGVVTIHPPQFVAYSRSLPSLGTICCIDDSKAILQNIAEILTPLGYRVLGIQDPKTALGRMEEEIPCLILLDILMPDVNGYELCRLMRQSHLLREIPIVLLTGKDGLIDKLRAKLLGVKEYMTKPVDPILLQECVARVLQSREVSDPLSLHKTSK